MPAGLPRRGLLPSPLPGNKKPVADSSYLWQLVEIDTWYFLTLNQRGPLVLLQICNTLHQPHAAASICWGRLKICTQKGRRRVTADHATFGCIGGKMDQPVLAQKVPWCPLLWLNCQDKQLVFRKLGLINKWEKQVLNCFITIRHWLKCPRVL